MCKINKIVEFLWCPSHVGIQPNEFVDSLAKQAITDGVALNMGLTYVDAINSLKKNLLNCGKTFGTPLQNRGVSICTLSCPELDVNHGFMTVGYIEG